MKNSIVFCIGLLLSPIVLFGAGGDISRTLSLGMKGEDVRELQKILNGNSETRIAESGPGSAGNETDYFGPATKRALIKFQEKYRGEILTPAGLAAGTGVLGAKTRAKILTIKSSELTTSTLPKNETKNTEKGSVVVMFPSQYSGKPGTTITISGAGFTTKANTVYFGEGYAVENASSWNGQNITLNIPSIPKGNYHLYVRNARGESNKDGFFVVTDGVTPEPRIESVTPSRVSRGETISIKGTGFTAKNNTIRTGVNIAESVSSVDSKTLSFVAPTQTLATTTASSLAKKSFVPVWVYVVNENGVSNGKSFELGL